MNDKHDIDLMNESIDFINEALINANDINKQIIEINKNIPQNIIYNIRDFDFNIEKIKKDIIVEKKKKLIQMICSSKTDIIKLLNNRVISLYDLIEISEIYIKLMVRNKNYVPYYKNLVSVSDPFNYLLKEGLDYDLLNNLNDDIINYLIDNNLMYNIDGFKFGYIFTGILSMFGIKVSNNELDSSGFIFGDTYHRLSGINDLYDFICKSIGFDSLNYDIKNKYKLSGYDGNEYTYVDGYIKNLIDSDEVNASYNSKYFTIGKMGDILTNDDLLLILDNDKEGYYVLESNDNTKGLVVSYYNYDELRNYKITNMVSFYENVTKNSKYSNARNSNFIETVEYISSLNITDLNKSKLKLLYNSNNKNPNCFSNPLIDEKKVIEKNGDITTIKFQENENTIKILPILDKNILPENKFSTALPPVSYGNINYMEINDASVNYEIININNDIFDQYKALLRNFGYKYINEGVWKNKDYKVVLLLSEDNTRMALSLFLAN